jgi:stage IV sporulation protein B
MLILYPKFFGILLFFINFNKEEKIMAKKFKRFCTLALALLLLTALIPSNKDQLSSVAASVSDAFSQSFDESDYREVMSEPDVLTGNGYATLSKKELRSLRLYPGGTPFGVKFMTEGVLVVGFCDVDTSSGRTNPSSSAGLSVGDRIISVNGKRISGAAELSQIIESSAGKSISLIYRRGSCEYSATLTPAYSVSEGCYKTGAYVKDNGAGIGTVTYIIPGSLEFGGLGHGICEGEGGKLVPISRGSVVNVGIDGVEKGESGDPGELRGHFKSGKSGSLLQNTDCGVFGVLATLPSGLPSEPLYLGLREDVEEGRAYIWSTLEGSTPKRYEIEISNIDRSASAGKCFTVKVTDKNLIATSGGIVQGMSGSPIIQNGKLVGAVTHVMINDPTTGYGIFIENMLAAANSQVQPKAA